MAFFSKKSDTKVFSPRDSLIEIFKFASGSNFDRHTSYDIFHKIIAFKGVSGGVGTSTVVSGVALALAKAGVNVCVLDTSILKPTQELYLKSTDVGGDVADWFDLPFTNKSALRKSKLNGLIKTLAFRERDITHLCSPNEDDSLVELALRDLNSKFDVILIDVCNEPTCVTSVCLQRAHRVFQVWSNDVLSLSSVDSFITNNLIRSCLVDKMRLVVGSKLISDINTDWKPALDRYNVKMLTSNILSIDVARIMATGKFPYDYPSDSEGVESFTNCVNDIASKILGLDRDDSVDRGSLTINDLVDKVSRNVVGKIGTDSEQVDIGFGGEEGYD